MSFRVNYIKLVDPLRTENISINGAISNDDARFHALLCSLSNSDFISLGNLDVLIREFKLDIFVEKSLQHLRLHRYLTIDIHDCNRYISIFKKQIDINLILCYDENYLHFLQTAKLSFSERLLANSLILELGGLCDNHLYNENTVYSVNTSEHENAVYSVNTPEHENAVYSVNTPEHENTVYSVNTSEHENAVYSVNTSEHENAVYSVNTSEHENTVYSVNTSEHENAVYSVNTSEHENAVYSVNTSEHENAVYSVNTPEHENTVYSVNTPENENTVYSVNTPEHENTVYSVNTSEHENTVIPKNDSSVRGDSELIENILSKMRIKSRGCESIQLRSKYANQDFHSLQNSETKNSSDTDYVTTNLSEYLNDKAQITGIKTCISANTNDFKELINNSSKKQLDKKNQNEHLKYNKIITPTTTTTVVGISSSSECIPLHISKPNTQSISDFDWLSLDSSTSNYIFNAIQVEKLAFADAQDLIRAIHHQTTKAYGINSLPAYIKTLIKHIKSNTLHKPWLKNEVPDVSSRVSLRSELINHHSNYEHLIKNNRYEDAKAYLKQHGLIWDGSHISFDIHTHKGGIHENTS